MLDSQTNTENHKIQTNAFVSLGKLNLLLDVSIQPVYFEKPLSNMFFLW